jgi:hypothetical protein
MLLPAAAHTKASSIPCCCASGFRFGDRGDCNTVVVVEGKIVKKEKEKW